MKNTLSKILQIIAEIMAVALVIVFLLHYIDANYPFLPELGVKIVNGLMQWGALLLVAVVGVQAMIRRNILFLILFLVVLAAVIVFMFFPGTIESWLPNKATT